MGNKIDARDAAFKAQMEHHFTLLVSLMKTGRPADKLLAESRALQHNLQNAVTLLGAGDETQ